MALLAPHLRVNPLVNKPLDSSTVRGHADLSNPVVLVIDDDELMCQTLEQAFRGEHIRVVSARTGLEGLGIARHLRVHVLVVDYRLPDLDGLECIRRLRSDGIQTSFILISGYVTVPVAVEAMQLGAVTVLEKPVEIDDLLIALQRALKASNQLNAPHGSNGSNGLNSSNGLNGSNSSNGLRHAQHGLTGEAPASIHSVSNGSPSSTAERWAMLVLRARASSSDLRTLSAWARAVHLSRSALSDCCRLVHVSPRDARDFTRLFRAIHYMGDLWQPEAVMDFADSRTFRKFLERAGLAHITRVPTVEDFLTSQRWIPADNPALVALRNVCRELTPPPS
jgi:ActR/RegA family two-component response regulator